MNNIFITHTPLLLEEFPVNGTLFLKHEIRTPKRTVMFTDALQSLGWVIRINLTLWFLATEHSAGDVHDVILSRLKSESRTDDAGDIFVIDANSMACSTSQETVKELQEGFSGLNNNKKGAVTGVRVAVGDASLTAREVRLKLKAEGLKGRELKRKVNEVLAGKTDVRWAKHEAAISVLRSKGYGVTEAEDRTAIEVGGSVSKEAAAFPKASKDAVKTKKISARSEALRLLREQKADELGIKPTDAMFWKITGSFESGKRGR